MARAPKSFTVDSWSNSDGEFGVCVTEPARTRDGCDIGIMEIELTPDKLIELSSDLLQLGLRMKKHQENNVSKTLMHLPSCPFINQPLDPRVDACECASRLGLEPW